MKHTFETQFDLGDRVYHKLPGSPVGMVTGISFNVARNNITYYVTFDPLGGEVQCLDWELSETKTII